MRTKRHLMKAIAIGVMLMLVVSVVSCSQVRRRQLRVVHARLELIEVPLLHRKAMAAVVGDVPYFSTGLVNNIPAERLSVATLDRGGKLGELRFRRGAKVYWPMAGVDDVREWYGATGEDFSFAFDTGPRMISEDYVRGVSLYVESVSGRWVRFQPVEMQTVLGDYVVTARKTGATGLKELTVPRKVFDEGERRYIESSEYYRDYGYGHLYRAGRGATQANYYRDRSMQVGSYLVVIPHKIYVASLPKRGDSIVRSKLVRKALGFSQSGQVRESVLRFEVPYTWSVADDYIGMPAGEELEFFILEPGEKAEIRVYARQDVNGAFARELAAKRSSVWLGKLPASQSSSRSDKYYREVEAVADGIYLSIELSAPLGRSGRAIAVFKKILKTFEVGDG